ncbi:MAG: hypothetical protein OXC18_05930 [Desulfurellaceae bacterium]|nr:hypothetical protein [Desulfurellaceae bacterium]
MTRDEEIRQDLERQWAKLDGPPRPTTTGISRCTCGHPALVHEHAWTGRCRIRLCGCHQFTARQEDR